MIAVLATLHIKPGTGAAFEADFVEWSKTVKANEPETLQYNLTRSRDDAQVYYVLEMYASDAAFKSHIKNLMARPAGTDFFVAPPKIEMLDIVA
jgi:quinol monooxygenase YgiN